MSVRDASPARITLTLPVLNRAVGWTSWWPGLKNAARCAVHGRRL